MIEGLKAYATRYTVQSPTTMVAVDIDITLDSKTVASLDCHTGGGVYAPGGRWRAIVFSTHRGGSDAIVRAGTYREAMDQVLAHIRDGLVAGWLDLSWHYEAQSPEIPDGEIYSGHSPPTIEADPWKY